MRFRLTRHAQEEMARRQIPRHLLDQVLDQPQQVVEERGGRRAYQSQLDFAGGRMLLLRAIVDDRSDPGFVVTVYRTSKVQKYWR